MFDDEVRIYTPGSLPHATEDISCRDSDMKIYSPSPHSGQSLSSAEEQSEHTP